MNLHTLKAPEGSRKPRKRVGRGEGSGLGCTAGKGHKGQNARSGGKTKRGFEGGQMPIQRRIPKRGFTNIFKKVYAIVNVGQLSAFPASTAVDLAFLKQAGLVRSSADCVKVLAEGDLAQALVLRVDHISEAAKAKVLQAGGRIEEVKHG